MINVNDTVRQISTGKIGTVDQIHLQQYWVRFGTDFTDRALCNADDLELINRPTSGGEGFTPTRGIIE